MAFGERAGQQVRRRGSGFGYEGERPAFTGARGASVHGFSLHANVSVPAHRRDQLERLIRYYTARGAVSLKRLEADANGDLLYTFTQPMVGRDHGHQTLAVGTAGEAGGAGTVAAGAPGALRRLCGTPQSAAPPHHSDTTPARRGSAGGWQRFAALELGTAAETGFRPRGGFCPHERSLAGRVPGAGDGWTPSKICFEIPIRLNLIEILSERIKYTWLPFSAYQCLNALSEALEYILSHVGSKYQITFA
jgi:hypothetical protein